MTKIRLHTIGLELNDLQETDHGIQEREEEPKELRTNVNRRDKIRKRRDFLQES